MLSRCVERYGYDRPTNILVGRNNAVGTGACYRLQCYGVPTPVQAREFLYSKLVETDAGAHPTSCTVGTEHLPGESGPSGTKIKNG